jgi:hypothetical protein
MFPLDEKTPKTAPVLVWWIAWFAIMASLATTYFEFCPDRGGETTGGLRFVPIFPLALSIVVRWVVLPRFTRRIRAFPVFIIGIALAEGSGIAGILLVPELALIYCVLAVLGLVQFIPLFAKHYEE